MYKEPRPLEPTLVGSTISRLSRIVGVVRSRPTQGQHLVSRQVDTSSHSSNHPAIPRLRSALSQRSAGETPVESASNARAVPRLSLLAELLPKGPKLENHSCNLGSITLVISISITSHRWLCRGELPCLRHIMLVKPILNDYVTSAVAAASAKLNKFTGVQIEFR